MTGAAPSAPAASHAASKDLSSPKRPTKSRLMTAACLLKTGVQPIQHHHRPLTALGTSRPAGFCRCSTAREAREARLAPRLPRRARQLLHGELALQAADRAVADVNGDRTGFYDKLPLVVVGADVARPQGEGDGLGLARCQRDPLESV